VACIPFNWHRIPLQYITHLTTGDPVINERYIPLWENQVGLFRGAEAGVIIDHQQWPLDPQRQWMAAIWFHPEKPIQGAWIDPELSGKLPVGDSKIGEGLADIVTGQSGELLNLPTHAAAESACASERGLPRLRRGGGGVAFLQTSMGMSNHNDPSSLRGTFLWYAHSTKSTIIGISPSLSPLSSRFV
jgi:hypothetical protein